MERFRKLCEAFSQLNVPKNKYVIIGSAPMAIRSLRDVNDLDVIVTPEELDRLRPMAFKKDERMVTFNPEAGCITISDNIIAFSGEVTRLEAQIFSFEALLRFSEDWNGYRVWGLTQMIEFKKKLCRDKDYDDLLLLSSGPDPKKWVRPNEDDEKYKRLMLAVRAAVMKYHCTDGNTPLYNIAGEIIELSRAHDDLVGPS